MQCVLVVLSKCQTTAINTHDANERSGKEQINTEKHSIDAETMGPCKLEETTLLLAMLWRSLNKINSVTPQGDNNSEESRCGTSRDVNNNQKENNSGEIINIVGLTSKTSSTSAEKNNGFQVDHVFSSITRNPGFKIAACSYNI